MPEDREVEEKLDAIGRRDHSTTSEYRIFGPPGTGKTTNLTRQIRRAVERFGKDSVLVTSFSRAAAAELAGQHLPLSADRVGTLHSHCWNALGRPQIAEANVTEWNARNPGLRITPFKGLPQAGWGTSGRGSSVPYSNRGLLVRRVESRSRTKTFLDKLASRASGVRLTLEPIQKLYPYHGFLRLDRESVARCFLCSEATRRDLRG